MDRSQLARQIASLNANNLPHSKQFNPVVLLIIEEVIKILLEKCNLNLTSLKNPWFWDRWLLKRYIASARETVVETKLKYPFYEPYTGSINDIYDSLLAYGKTLDQKTLNALQAQLKDADVD